MKHLNPRPVNNSTLSIDQFDSYYKEQVKPPYTNYFDEMHMEEIKNHVDAYFENYENNQYSEIDSLTNDICNSPITMDDIKTYNSKLKNRKHLVLMV